VLFEDDGRLVKKVAGYHQFHAVRAVVQSVLKASAPGGHAQGRRRLAHAGCRQEHRDDLSGRRADGAPGHGQPDLVW
jgi:type I restriction enzyme R subunit